MTEHVPIENRKHTRVTTELEAELTLEDKAHYRGKIKNISFSGAYLFCHNPSDITPGSTGQLSIILQSSPHQSTIEFACKIVRTDESGTGLKFISIDLAGYQQFRNMMIYNSADPDRLMDELGKIPGLQIIKD